MGKQRNFRFRARETHNPSPPDKYAHLWDLKQPELMTETATSRVYKVTCSGQSYALKVLSEVGKKDEALGAAALKHFEGRGATRLIRSDDEAHLLEYVHGPALTQLVQDGQDDEANRIICEILNLLHRPYQKTRGELTSLRQRYKKLFHYADTSKDPLFSLAAEVANDLLNHPLNEVVLHGDIHHENILKHSQRGWLAIDPKGLYGESTFDIANVFYNPPGFPELIANDQRILSLSKTASRLMNMDQKRILSFAFTYGCLSAVWSKEDGFDFEPTLQTVRIIKHLLYSS